MKKVTSLVLAMMLLFAGANFAQTPAAMPAAKAKTVKKVEATKKAAPEVKAQTAQKAEAAKKAAPTKAAATTTTMKKDGTPDKRFKANAAVKSAAGPTKKDGTPDMRYKQNKAAAATPAKK